MSNLTPQRHDAAAFKIHRARRYTSLRANARAFVVWRAAQAVEWDISMSDLAARVDMPIGEVRNIVAKRGWGGFLRRPCHPARPSALADLMRAA